MFTNSQTLILLHILLTFTHSIQMVKSYSIGDMYETRGKKTLLTALQLAAKPGLSKGNGIFFIHVAHTYLQAYAHMIL